MKFCSKIWQGENKLLLRSLCLFLLLLPLLIPHKVKAQNINCPNRFVTFVNPVRGRDRWYDKTVRPLEKQYLELRHYGFFATWLLQHDAFTDREVLSVINTFTSKHELGVFLEITPKLAYGAGVIYPHAVAWDDPNAIFLSGYTRSERRRLIRKVFEDFKKEFGYYPKSVGAWWIDSYSLEIMKNNYDIQAVLIVSDQKTTDDYGVWGQWWGMPYIPSKANVLVPASEKRNSLDVVVVQWAQRDFEKAYGEGIEYSNNSLQANDYLERGNDTGYFKELTGKYLSCDRTLGQITVGLETGMESVTQMNEYKRQLAYLAEIAALEPVTLGNFTGEYKKVYTLNPSEIVIVDEESVWQLTPLKRENKYLNDRIIYSQNVSFKDYFVEDESRFLNRRLPITKNITNGTSGFGVLILSIFVSYLIYVFYEKSRYFFPTIVFVASSFLLHWKSYFKYGWIVFYGPLVGNIALHKVMSVFLGMIPLLFLIKYFEKRSKKPLVFAWFLPLTYSVDFVVSKVRYSFIEGVRFFGFSVKTFRFIGFSIGDNGISFVNREFMPVVSESLLRINIDNLHSNILIYFIAIPAFHIVLAYIFYKSFIKLSVGKKMFIISVVILYLLYIFETMNSNPRIVL